MKTNGNATPAYPGKQQIQSRRRKPAAKQQISDRAFYLIALATLLQETAKPGAVQELLAPAKYSGLHQTAQH
jgi:hypothetical protein